MLMVDWVVSQCLSVMELWLRMDCMDLWGNVVDGSVMGHWDVGDGAIGSLTKIHVWIVVVVDDEMAILTVMVVAVVTVVMASMVMMLVAMRHVHLVAGHVSDGGAVGVASLKTVPLVMLVLSMAKVMATILMLWSIGNFMMAIVAFWVSLMRSIVQGLIWSRVIAMSLRTTISVVADLWIAMHSSMVAVHLGLMEAVVVVTMLVAVVLLVSVTISVVVLVEGWLLVVWLSDSVWWQGHMEDLLLVMVELKLLVEWSDGGVVWGSHMHVVWVGVVQVVALMNDWGDVDVGTSNMMGMWGLKTVINFMDLNICVWSVDQSVCSVETVSRVVVWNNGMWLLVNRLAKVVSWIISLPSWMVRSSEAMVIVHMSWVMSSMVHVSLPDVVVLDELAIDRLEWNKVWALVVRHLMVRDLVVNDSW